MTDAQPENPEGNPNEFEQTICKQEKRKIEARSRRNQSPWFGLGMFGLIGWSVVLPTLMGILAGSWIDNQWPSQISWKLTLMFVGVVTGCLNAWYWIQKETIE